MQQPLKPKQSYKHTLQEISINRESPCELIRELVSNSYDAGAKNIYIFPLLQKEGFIFFDDGEGLSMEKCGNSEDSPYVAFFSIGLKTKTKGKQIGYKCQGSKLCFASSRFALITKCSHEDFWRTKIIENPADTLTSDYLITPDESKDPSLFLKNFFSDPDHKTQKIIDFLNFDFFKEHFLSGTMIIIEKFKASDNFSHFFSTKDLANSYIYNYIRFNTAHGDTRHITTEQGFLSTDINAVKSHHNLYSCNLRIWKTSQGTNLEENLLQIPNGWPYLLKKTATDSPPHSPLQVENLRKGRFSGRHATAVEFNGEVYTLIMAIDGKRKALDEYASLGRQKDSRSGILLSSQRGIFLSAHGVKICSYNHLWNNELLKEYKILEKGYDHYVFMIDGDFELITNRNSLAEDSIQLLTNPNFIKLIKGFLNDIINKDAQLLKKLIQRLNKDVTEEQEEKSHSVHEELKQNIQDNRDRFCVESVDVLQDKWFVEPAPGEEHFIGALYTLFSHVVTKDNKLYKFWQRPITFKSYGIDSVGVIEEEKGFEFSNLSYIEYKYTFSLSDEFNHPLSITSRIICWDFDSDINEMEGKNVMDSYGYVGTVTNLISFNDTHIGVEISQIRNRNQHKFLGSTIIALSLKSLLNQTFRVSWIPKICDENDLPVRNSRNRRRR